MLNRVLEVLDCKRKELYVLLDEEEKSMLLKRLEGKDNYKEKYYKIQKRIEDNTMVYNHIEKLELKECHQNKVGLLSDYGTHSNRVEFYCGEKFDVNWNDEKITSIVLSEVFNSFVIPQIKTDMTTIRKYSGENLLKMHQVGFISDDISFVKKDLHLLYDVYKEFIKEDSIVSFGPNKIALIEMYYRLKGKKNEKYWSINKETGINQSTLNI